MSIRAVTTSSETLSVVARYTDDRLVRDLFAEPLLDDHEKMQNAATAICRWGRARVVELAVRSGHLRPDAVHEDGTPLVHIAAKYGAVDLLRAIVLEYGVDADMLCKIRTGDTALGAACFNGQEAAALFLINEAPGCDLNARGGPRRQTPLMLAAMRGLLGVVKALVGKGVEGGCCRQ